MHNDVYILQYKKDNFVVRDGLRPRHRNDESSTILTFSFSHKRDHRIRIDPNNNQNKTTCELWTIPRKSRDLVITVFLGNCTPNPNSAFAGRNLTFLHQTGSICPVMGLLSCALVLWARYKSLCPKGMKDWMFDASRYCHFSFREIASEFFVRLHRRYFVNINSINSHSDS